MVSFIPPTDKSFAPPKPARPRVIREDLLVPEFTVVYDQQEGLPWTFAGLRANHKHHWRPLLVKMEKVHLKTADYSIKGLEHLIAIERKSLSDFLGTVGGGHERFEREHERMAEICGRGGRACVVIEGTVEQAMTAKERGETKVDPASIEGTRAKWFARFGIPWLFEGNRRQAEITAWRLIEAFWEANKERTN